MRNGCRFCQINFAFNVTWLFYCVVFLVHNITWCMCYGDYGLHFGGGSYSSVYVPPPMFVSLMVL